MQQKEANHLNAITDEICAQWRRTADFWWPAKLIICLKLGYPAQEVQKSLFSGVIWQQLIEWSKIPSNHRQLKVLMGPATGSIL